MDRLPDPVIEMILTEAKCLMCRSGVKMSAPQMAIHLAEIHFGYFLHGCKDCAHEAFACEDMAEHSDMFDHRVELYKVSISFCISSSVFIISSI